MNHKLEQLTKDDVQSLKQLRVIFAEAFEEEEEYKEVPEDGYLSTLLSNNKNIVIVSRTKEGNISGGLFAYELPKIKRSCSEIYLYDIAVAKQYRRQGIATALITNLLALGRKLGATEVYVQAHNEDLEAMSLYSKICDRREDDVSHFTFLLD